MNIYEIDGAQTDEMIESMRSASNIDVFLPLTAAGLV